MIELLLVALGVFGILAVVMGAIWVWTVFCYWLSDGEFWGLLMALMAPAAIFALAIAYTATM